MKSYLKILKMNGEYISRAYKTRFTLDLVSGNVQISNVFGTSGMTYFSLVIFWEIIKFLLGLRWS